MDKNKIEAITKIVYGETFGRYDKDEFLEFLKPFEVRLAANNIPLDSFKGKRCLDAGCGGGRGSILMARAGAKEVVSYDLSERNIETTKRYAKLFGLENVKTHCGSLLEIPFEDSSFDVIWCNGVLHHTVDADRGLCEISRILKDGGNLWLYLYGSGGLYWYMVDFIRELVKDIEIPTAIALLAGAGIPTIRIAEFIDDWYVPMLTRYTDTDISKRLVSLGYETPKRLAGGMSYDTSVRTLLKNERVWMGDGDQRYWVKKNKTIPPTQETALPNIDNKGSAYPESTEVASFTKDFNRLRDTIKSIETKIPQTAGSLRISYASRMQLWLRDEMTTADKFDGELFRNWINKESDRLDLFSLD